MKKLKLKSVIRNGLPETNSSSSHSVIINRLSKTDKTDFLLLLPNKDGIIEVPIPTKSFSNVSFEACNNPLIKLQLVISLIITLVDNLLDISKLLGWLEILLCNFTGAKKVRYLGLNNIESQWCYGEESEYCWEHLREVFGEVDHQSIDLLYKCILEKSQVILDFIFNSDSWLFLSSDSYNNDLLINNKLENFYKSSNNYISIEFGYNIGRMDFPLYNYPNKSCISDSLFECRDGALRYLMFDPLINEFRFLINKFQPPEYVLKVSFSTSDIIFIDGEGYYILFTSENLCNNKNKDFTNTFTSNWEYIKENKKTLKDGEDFKLFKINININDYSNVF